MSVSVHKTKVRMSSSCCEDHLFGKIHSHSCSWIERSEQIPAGTTKFEDSLSRCNEEFITARMPPVIIASPTCRGFQVTCDPIPVKSASFGVSDFRFLYGSAQRTQFTTRPRRFITVGEIQLQTGAE